MLKQGLVRLIRFGWFIVFLYVLLFVPVSAFYLTPERNSLYNEPYLLWQDSVSKSPLKPRPYMNAAYELHRRGRPHDAIPYYEMAYQLSFYSHVRAADTAITRQLVLSNISEILVTDGRWQEADQVLRKLWTLAPAFPAAAINWSKILGDSGQLEHALLIANEGIELGLQAYSWYPNPEILYLNRAEILRTMGRWKEAEPDYFKAASIDPKIRVPECPF